MHRTSPSVSSKGKASGGQSDVAPLIRAGLDALLEPGSVTEARILGTKYNTVSGYYDDRDALARDLAEYDGHAPALYVVVNPVKPELLARAVNHLVRHAKVTTADTDILRRRWLLLDFDPVRPSGISSTHAEHQAALDRAKVVRDWLGGGGWPDPLFIDSGNGGHLPYRIDLPNTPEALQLLTRCVEALAFQFSDSVVSLDGTVTNAARIWKVPGSLACKGDSTSDRPHRRARILDTPARLIPVPLDLLQGLAAQALKPENNGYKPAGLAAFDLAAWITAHPLPVASIGTWNGGRKWILNPCPWNAEHVNRPAYIVQHASGAIAAGCHHNGCSGKGWRELRELFEPNRQVSSVSITNSRTTVRPINQAGERSALTPVKLDAALNAWRYDCEHGMQPTRVKTPYAKLNSCLGGGFGPGELIFIGARPGVGKSAMETEIAVSAAAGGTGVLIITREMVIRSLIRRMLAQQGRIDARKVKVGLFDPAEYGVLTATISRLSPLPVWLVDQAITLADIISLVERWAFTPALGLVLVDYLQLVRVHKSSPAAWRWRPCPKGSRP